MAGTTVSGGIARQAHQPPSWSHIPACPAWMTCQFRLLYLSVYAIHGSYTLVCTTTWYRQPVDVCASQ